MYYYTAMQLFSSRYIYDIVVGGW